MTGIQLTRQAFEDEWWKLTQTGLGYVESYRQLEEWHLAKCGAYRYASYTSFANIRDRKRKKK